MIISRNRSGASASSSSALDQAVEAFESHIPSEDSSDAAGESAGVEGAFDFAFAVVAFAASVVALASAEAEGSSAGLAGTVVLEASAAFAGSSVEAAAFDAVASFAASGGSFAEDLQTSPRTVGAD